MLYLTLVALCSILTLTSIVAVLQATSARKRHGLRAGEPAVPVSVLKPLCGADDALESNLESFFALDHPDYELIFGVQGEADPAIEVVRRLRARHPGVKTRLVVHNGGRGLNPKVSNLTAMLEAGSHDVVVISDSNVRVAPHYLAEMAALLSLEKTGLVTSLIAGTGEETVGAAFETLQLNGPTAGIVAISQGFGGRTLVVGKSMMFRRSVLERLGGLRAVANLLAEDYIIGRMFREAGYEVRLAATPIENVCRRTTVMAFARRTLRWSLLRWRLKPLVYPFEIVANPAAVAIAAPLFGVTALWPLGWALCCIAARDAAQTARLRGWKNLPFVLPLGFAKDIVLIGVWFAAPFCRHVAWRGRRLRISAGTLLFPDEPMDAAETIRVEG